MAEKKLYDVFLNYNYQELEELVATAKDKTEHEFYARLCDFYIDQRQERVMQEKPF